MATKPSAGASASTKASPRRRSRRWSARSTTSRCCANRAGWSIARGGDAAHPFGRTLEHLRTQPRSALCRGAGRAVDGGGAVGDRPDRRLDGAAAHHRLAAGRAPSGLGLHRVLPRGDGDGRRGRQAGRPVWPTARLHRLDRPVLRRRRCCAAWPPPCPAGRAFAGCRASAPAAIQTCSLIVMGDMFAAARARPVAGDQQHRLRHRQRHRPVGRRLALRQLLVALDLPAERAGVSGDGRRAAVRAAAAGPARRAPAHRLARAAAGAWSRWSRCCWGSRWVAANTPGLSPEILALGGAAWLRRCCCCAPSERAPSRSSPAVCCAATCRALSCIAGVRQQHGLVRAHLAGAAAAAAGAGRQRHRRGRAAHAGHRARPARLGRGRSDHGPHRPLR